MFKHIIKLIIDGQLAKTYQWSEKRKYKQFSNNEEVELPNRLCDIQLEYSNNFTSEKILVDLWKDKDVRMQKHYSPFPYEYEEFLRFDGTIFVDKKPIRLFIALSNKIERSLFTLNTLHFEKACVCKCGAINPSSWTTINNRIKSCNECKKF